MLSYRQRWFKRIVCAALFATLFPASALASVPEKQELQAFVEDFMERKMEEHHVPGAVVSVVQNGEISLLGGYGYANLEKKVSADPHATVFRLGSIAKTVTATAVMQLHESGVLELHEDIKHYIPGLKLSYLGGKPITAHHLMTHTAGFYESIVAVGRDREKQQPLAEAINGFLPSSVRAPGEQIAYSNQGMSLAGYLVEQIARQPYENVVEEQIFKPLAMNRSSFRFTESDPNLAASYSYAKGKYKPLPFSYIHHLPAGALNSTAEDISRYMIAHLQQGRYGNSRIFSEETAGLMHRTHFTSIKNMPGMAYGFYERYQNGLRLIEHDGGIDGYQSYLYLIPSENTGIFIATNSEGGSELREQFITAYLERYYPAVQELQPAANPTPMHELQKIEGYYIPNRAHLKGPLNFAQNLSTVQLEAVSDGVILFGDDRFVETDPYLFRSERGGERIYVDADTNVLALSSIPTMMYERQKSAFYHPLLHIAVLLGLALIYPIQAAVSAAVWLYGVVRRKRYGFNPIATIVSVLFILYFIFIVSIAEVLINDIPWWSYPFLYLPVILLATLLLQLTLRFVRKQKVTRWQYGFASVTAIFVAYLYVWDFYRI
ncbi:serine hydrolase domain-containing protein [Paenibacillus harenae]|uniref:serine hydrolase domain-containing protein n=1 Tax=Paenibacillus harenae TaxID=306543 RepID=UPI00278FADCA|nr:serine hydrolase domain-containing protein [Paenibacillus harenae]MDQ0063799.1 CubicO group peptidase (beta-lactamase class C family) [Paenibacillus harenae]